MNQNVIIDRQHSAVKCGLTVNRRPKQSPLMGCP